MAERMQWLLQQDKPNPSPIFTQEERGVSFGPIIQLLGLRVQHPLDG